MKNESRQGANAGCDDADHETHRRKRKKMSDSDARPLFHTSFFVSSFFFFLFRSFFLLPCS